MIIIGKVLLRDSPIFSRLKKKVSVSKNTEFVFTRFPHPCHQPTGLVATSSRLGYVLKSDEPKDVPGGFGPDVCDLPIAPKHDKLVGGWTNPFEKYARQIGSFPQVIRGENKEYLKSPPSKSWGIYGIPLNSPALMLPSFLWEFADFYDGNLRVKPPNFNATTPTSRK